MVFCLSPRPTATRQRGSGTRAAIGEFISSAVLGRWRHVAGGRLAGCGSRGEKGRQSLQAGCSVGSVGYHTKVKGTQREQRRRSGAGIQLCKEDYI